MLCFDCLEIWGRLHCRFILYRGYCLRKYLAGYVNLLYLTGGGDLITGNMYLYNLILTPMIGLAHLVVIYKLVWWIKKHKRLNHYLFGEVSLYGKET